MMTPGPEMDRAQHTADSPRTWRKMVKMIMTIIMIIRIIVIKIVTK
jgi:hypothetical protein